MTDNVYEQPLFTKGEADAQDAARAPEAEQPQVSTTSISEFLTYFAIVQGWVGAVNEFNGWKANKNFIRAAIKSHAPALEPYLENVLAGNEMALITSEVSEMLEGKRKQVGESEHIPDFANEEEELADIVIRCMDYADERKLRLAQCIVAKIRFNAGRGHRHGGKLS